MKNFFYLFFFIFFLSFLFSKNANAAPYGSCCNGGFTYDPTRASRNCVSNQDQSIDADSVCAPTENCQNQNNNYVCVTSVQKSIGTRCYNCDFGLNYLYEDNIPTCRTPYIPLVGYKYFTPTKTDCPTGLVCYPNYGTCEDPKSLPGQQTKPIFCDKGAVGVPGAGFEYSGIETALGCIPTDPQEFVKVILNWGIGLAGGIAFLFMLLAGFGIVTSQGNPEQLKAHQEQLTSAIIGLLFIIFSVFLLRLFGTPIMNIGGS